MLSITGLRKSYGAVAALTGVDLEVPPGEVVALLGPNGAGKSTLVSIVAGLRRADSGSVHVAGVDALARPRAARRRIGLAPQELGLYPLLTVRENLRFVAGLSGLPRRTRADRIAETADLLDLAELLGRVAGELSGGQQRRLHTAMALLHRPPLLLLDEVTTGADVDSRHRLLAAIRGLADTGSAVLYSTHYLPEVDELGATVALIDHGAVVARGSVPELVAAHASPAVDLHFRGQAPALDLAGRGAGLRLETEGDRLRVVGADTAAAMGAVFAALREDATRVRSVQLGRPDLESAYLRLTGRQPEPDGSVG